MKSNALIKICCVVMSMSFFMVVAMEDDLSSYASVKRFLLGEDVSSEEEREEHENPEQKLDQFYANCPDCFKFFQGNNKKILERVFKEHCISDHNKEVSDSNNYIRNIIGFWKIKRRCPYLGEKRAFIQGVSDESNSRQCVYDCTNFEPCSEDIKPWANLAFHIGFFHSKIPVDIPSLFQNGNIKVSFCATNGSLQNNESPPMGRLYGKTIAEKNEIIFCKITYTCPFYGEGTVTSGRKCKMNQKTIYYTDSKVGVNRKIAKVRCNILNHIMMFHEGSVEKWSEWKEKLIPTWMQVEEI